MVWEGAERRLTAVLALDMVGYSGLIEADEAGTVIAVNHVFDKVVGASVTADHGRIVRMIGDGALAVFASAVDAVQCAQSIQTAMQRRNEDVPPEKRILFRIGINVGDVIFEGEEIHGDAVNVAVRLEGLADPGGVCVSAGVQEYAAGRLPVDFEDMGEQRVKNIRRPVRAYRVVVTGGEGESAATRPASGDGGRPASTRRRRRVAAAVAGMAVLLAVGSIAWWQVRPLDLYARWTHTPPKRMSVVVLPFKNLSGDPKREHLVDGITGDLIDDLSRIRDAFVIARGTSFTFKGKTSDPKTVAKGLKVRYVLDGNVLPAGDRVRVNAQLIDGETGRQIWADRFDRDMDKLFSLQDEITGRIGRVLNLELLESESRRVRRGPPADLEAWDYALQGFVKVYVIDQQTDETLLEARDLLEKAIKLDPALGLAWTGMAHFHYKASSVGIRGISRFNARKRFMEAALRAVALSPDDSDARAGLGMAYRLNRKPEKALAACRTALNLNPNHEEANVCAGMAMLALGRTPEAFPYLEKSLRLNPYNRPYRRLYFTGLAHLLAGDHEQAVTVLQKAVASDPKFPSSHYVLASALAWLGRMDEARAALSDFEKIDDGRRSTIEGLNLAIGYASPDFDHVLEGLRRAGMPETEADRPPSMSIVVLPFANLSADPTQDYFADGITDDVITALSRIRGAFVISRGTSFTFKGKSADAKEVAKDLKVRYVLEGSVRRSGKRVRINTQLTDGQRGEQIWSRQFDREIEDRLAIQAEVTGQIAATLKLELLDAENRRMRTLRVGDVDAWDYALRAWATLITKPISEKNTMDAKALLREALKRDPNSALAWTAMARVHANGTTSGWATASKAESRRLMLEAAKKAVALDPKSADAHRQLGFAYRFHRRLKEATSACQTAIDLNPNHHEAYQCLAMIRLASGRPDEALPLFEKSVRLNPREGRPARRNFFIGWANLMAGRYERAVQLIREGIAANPKMPAQYWVLASALGKLGQVDEARTALDDFIRVDKGRRGTIARMRKQYDYVANFDHALEGLRRAGMPETEVDKPPSMSIVVLPFANLSGDPKQDYFADGITDDVITALSRIRGAFVIGRATTFSLKGKAVDAREVAKDLNVRYVLGGSVRRVGDEVRVNVEMIDGGTGSRIWSDKFDRMQKTVFSLQSDVTGRIAAALRLELREAEGRRLREGPPANLKAHDYALRAWVELFAKPVTKQATSEARRLLDKALALDSDSALAWIGMARIHYIAGTHGWGGTDTFESRRRQLGAAQRAVALDPKSADAHAQLGFAYRLNRQNGKAVASCRTALELNPNHDDAFQCLAMAEIALGQPARALPLFEKSFRLNPRIGNAGRRYFFVSLAQFFSGDYRRAMETAETGYAANPQFRGLTWALLCGNVLLGHKDKAAKAYADFKRLGGERSIAKMRARHRYLSPDFDRMLDCFRRMGMPETADAMPQVAKQP